MSTTRRERDSLGERDVPADALYGVWTVRALENFPLAGRPVARELVHAYGDVKHACLSVAHALRPWPADRHAALLAACDELAAGSLDDWLVVDALQGGAGTSTNMNVNEVVTNRALVLLGLAPGRYDVLSPLADANRFQSTNDTYPTALRVASIRGIRDLETAVVALTEAFQRKEREFAEIVKVGRTQLQDAVLTTLGRSMGAYADALARDRWRLSKCEERLRVVNLGGTAIGTGLGAPREYVFRVVDTLRDRTGIGLARAENLVDATQNTDAFVEVSGLLKTLAASLGKLATDLRLLGGGPDAGLGELALPAMQGGSSIMPAKVNPVIPEAVGQVAIAALGHDLVITQACAASNLELPQFLPLAADHLLAMVRELRQACRILTDLCVSDLQARRERCDAFRRDAMCAATALASHLGYGRATELVDQARRDGIGLREAALASGWVSERDFDAWTAPEAVTRLGQPLREMPIEEERR